MWSDSWTHRVGKQASHVGLTRRLDTQVGHVGRTRRSDAQVGLRSGLQQLAVVRSFVWRDVSGTVGGGRSDGRWTVVSSDTSYFNGHSHTPSIHSVDPVASSHQLIPTHRPFSFSGFNRGAWPKTVEDTPTFLIHIVGGQVSHGSCSCGQVLT